MGDLPAWRAKPARDPQLGMPAGDSMRPPEEHSDSSFCFPVRSKLCILPNAILGRSYISLLGAIVEIEGLLKALPTAATSPFAFIGYVTVVLAWLLIGGVSEIRTCSMPSKRSRRINDYQRYVLRWVTSTLQADLHRNNGLRVESTPTIS